MKQGFDSSRLPESEQCCVEEVLSVSTAVVTCACACQSFGAILTAEVPHLPRVLVS